MNGTLKFITRPEGKELLAITKLWQRVFHDDEAFVSTLIASDSYEGAVCIFFDNELGGMAHLLKTEGRGAYYCYAVATDEKYRRQGICKRILDYIKEKAKNDGVALLLHPVDDRLSEYYKKQGFVSLAYSYEFKCQGDGGAIFDISPEEYKRIRDFHLDGLGFYPWSVDMLKLTGARFIGFDIDGEYMAAAIVNERVSEIAASVHMTGRAVKRAANAAKAVVMPDDSPVGNSVAVMGYNVAQYSYFNLYLD